MRITRFKVERRGWKLRSRKPGTRVYIHPAGEGVFNQLFNRHVRPHQVWRKEIMPKVLKKLGLPADTKFRWSQKCGCTCNCSPGFIIQESVDFKQDGHTYHDICNVYVTVTDTPRADMAKAKKSKKVYLEFGSVAENAG